MTSSEMRDSELFMRKELDFSSDVRLLSYADTKANESPEYQKYGVHFFVDDYRFEGIYDQPQRSFKLLEPGGKGHSEPERKGQIQPKEKG